MPRLGCGSKVTRGRFLLRVIEPTVDLPAARAACACIVTYVSRKEEIEDGLSEKIAVETLARGVGVRS